MRRQQAGLTLLEVAMAGGILLVGLVAMSQLVNNALGTSSPGFGGMTIGPVVDQQLKLHAAHFKALMRGGANVSNRVTVGTESIYTVASTRSYVLPPMVGYGGTTYALSEQEISARITVNSHTVNAATDPQVGFTRFWKLDTYGTQRAGL